MQIKDVIRRFKGGIFVTTLLVMVENLAWIVEPSVFGAVIDAFINTVSGNESSSIQERLTALAIWISIYALNSGSGAVRRILDQKFSGTCMCRLQLMCRICQNCKGILHQKFAARAQLSKEYIDFLQHRLPEIIEQCLTIAGAVVALYLFDWRISVACFAIVVPLTLVNRIYNKHVIRYQKELHDRFESLYDVFETKDIEFIRSYFQSTAKAHQKIANWGAVNFSAMRLVLLGVFLMVLHISIDLNEFTTGDIYAIVAYLWTFVGSSEYLPDLLESWTSIKEVSMRMKMSDEEVQALVGMQSRSSLNCFVGESVKNHA
jgi:ABC-type multidrug transport system fused ATPase/permease subunit